ncbi:NADH-quinone oxidoreductase subunit N [Candidatus Nitrospira salsa]
MSVTDFTALLPILLTAGTALCSMMWIAISRQHLVVAIISVSGCLLSLASVPFAVQVAPRTITPLVQVDTYALFFIGLIVSASLIVTLLAYDYLKAQQGNLEEFYVLLILAAVGAEILTVATHFASLFLGLELLTISLYGLIAYQRNNLSSLEAGMKYLILSATSSAFLLFGMAFIYFETGSLEFIQLAAVFSQTGIVNVFLLAGFAMLLTGIGFKIAMVPFHMWTPDVYQGASAPVVAFIATVSKGAMVAVFLRLFLITEMSHSSLVIVVLSSLAAFSMVVGNLLALLQHNVKRLLACSSIAHMGYLLVALLASGSMAIEAVSFYLVAYFVTTLGAFGVIAHLSTSGIEPEQLEDYQGLFWRNPWIAGILTAMVLSLAGIPLTAGFIGKFYVIAAGLSAELWLLIILFVLNSVIGLFYYLRLIRVMASHPVNHAILSARMPTNQRLSGVVLAGLTILLLWFGTYPVPLIALIESMQPSMSNAVTSVTSDTMMTLMSQ